MRKALAISGMAIVLGTSGIILDANANSIERKNFRYERELKGKHSPKTDLFQRHKRGFAGTATSVSGDSLTIARADKTFTVTKSDSTRIFDKTWQNLDFASIRTGDKIAVHGIMTGTTIAARTIRDLTR